MTTVSVCSFTYNDANLLHGLLEDISGWSRKPDEIVLVDDGSSIPFELLPTEISSLPPVKLIHFEENKGFTIAKHTCISASSGEVILSIDSDSRLSKGFIENCLALLQDKTVGLVSGICMPAKGHDLFSNYIPAQMITPPGDEPFETTFINGPAFALRREVWDEVGGFSGHPERTKSDHYLSRTVLARGYKLIIDPAMQVREARKLDRHTAFRRLWTWCGEAWVKAVRPEESLPEHFRPLLREKLASIALISGTRHLEFFYFDLLQTMQFIYAFCNSLGSRGLIPLQTGEQLHQLVFEALAPYPLLRKVFTMDMLKLKALPLQEAQPPAPEDQSRRANVCDWQPLRDFFETLKDNYVLEYLDKEGVRLILEDDAKVEADFSIY